MREHLSQAAHRLALHMGNYVTVGVERYRDPGVTEDPLEDLGVLAGLQPERCERVPQVVEADVGGSARLRSGLKCLAARLWRSIGPPFSDGKTRSSCRGSAFQAAFQTSA